MAVEIESRMIRYGNSFYVLIPNALRSDSAFSKIFEKQLNAIRNDRQNEAIITVSLDVRNSMITVRTLDVRNSMITVRTARK